jgi:hypothetical protein
VFARFAGIGIGCQQFQATQVLEIQVGPDCDAETLRPQFSNSGGLEGDDDGGNGIADGDVSDDAMTSET